MVDQVHVPHELSTVHHSRGRRQEVAQQSNHGVNVPWTVVLPLVEDQFHHATTSIGARTACHFGSFGLTLRQYSYCCSKRKRPIMIVS